jgi:iron complex outermembrane receptor protein
MVAKRARRPGLNTGAMLLGLVVTPVIAQTATPPREALEEVIVTAQRREEDLQKTPLAVSVFGSESIRVNHIEGLQDVVMRIPNFYSDSVSRTQSSMAMRGAGSLEDSPGSDQAVALFVDDVYIGENSGLDFDFFDIQRVEVLRGPQGTLFGRNAVGGAVSVITQDPPKVPDASVELSYGLYDTLGIRGVAGGPIAGDKLLGQMAFSVRNSGGYVDNLTTGNKQQKEDVKSLRTKFRYADDGPFDATLSVDYMRDESQGIARKLIGDPVPGLDMPASKNKSRQNQDGGYDRKTGGATLHMNYDFGPATLTSITAYREGTHITHLDIDGSPLRVAEFDEQRNDIDQISQELRLGGETDKLVWVAGLYYLNLNVGRTEHVFIQGAPGSFVAELTEGGAFPEVLGQEIRTKSYAAFGQATYSFTPSIRLTGGLRYTSDNKSGHSYCIQPGLQCNEVYDVAVSHSWSAFTPKATLDVDVTDDVLAYLTVARGFKSGGFPSNLPTAVEVGMPFDPEYATNYEGGIKARWLEDRLQANVAVYHVDYSDLQVRQINGPYTIVGTAGKSSVNGVELEITARPAPGLDLFANYSYTRGRYDSLVLEGTDYSGNTLILTPENAATVGASYTTETAGGGSLSLRTDVLYKSTSYLDVSNDPSLTAKYPGIVNASMTYIFPNRNWEVSLFGRNLTGERTKLTAQDYSVFFFSADDLAAGKQAISTTYNAPMEWGVSVRWKM